MSNSRFNYHHYLSSNYIKRGVGNFCMNCGGKIGNIRPGLRNANQTWYLPDEVIDPVLIGFSHIVCPGDDDNDFDKEPAKIYPV